MGSSSSGRPKQRVWTDRLTKGRPMGRSLGSPCDRRKLVNFLKPGLVTIRWARVRLNLMFLRMYDRGIGNGMPLP